jgi:NAD(P)-dependent dehydrogenase (short-subunit alcohol dehydrogenase family)
MPPNPQSVPPVRFDGKTVIITGAGAGLGRAYALMYARLGANVVINDVSEKGAHAVCSEIKSGRLSFSLDVPDLIQAFTAGGKAVPAVFSAEDGEAIVKTALDAFGGVHVLVANAGVLRDRSFTAMSEQEWDLVVAVHLRGTYKVSLTPSSYLLIVSDVGQVRKSCLAYFPEAEIRSYCYDLLASRYLYVIICFWYIYVSHKSFVRRW